jgi:hypothetical protein
LCSRTVGNIPLLFKTDNRLFNSMDIII